MAKLIVGCGYLGLRVARLWRQAGDEVFVVTRSEQRAKSFAAEGFRPIVADVLRCESLAAFPSAETVLYAVGFDRAAGASLDEVYVDGLRNVLDALPSGTGKLIYASSTGVYGQTDGEAVDEDSPTEPTRAGGRACLAAEQMLAAHPLGACAIVLRLAGLYGPGRIPHSAAIRRGEPVAAPEGGSLNLIHIDDAAAVAVAAGQRARPPRTYVVSDGAPVDRREFYRELARLLAAPEPRFMLPPADAPVTDRATSDKRLENNRMLRELGISLTYPDYRRGLAAIIAAEAVGPADG